ncbi:MAG: hypothetical protein J6V44_13140 [Methanobrevibacter sp.]|nr:hypothetical protein [Methanobrevibacter sp.]
MSRGKTTFIYPITIEEIDNMTFKYIDELLNLKKEQTSDYRALVFHHKDGPKDSDVNLYTGKYHRGCAIHIIDMDNITEDIFDNIRNNRYCYFYITTDSRKERRKIRNIIKEKCNKEVHIMLYSKIVNNIHIMEMRK